MPKRIFHGHALRGKHSSTHHAWAAMRERCLNPNNKRWPAYGGRGIKVCDRWLPPVTGYLNFLADMGERPSSDLSLDRIDNDGDYTPDNCRWASRKQQQSNRRNSVLVDDAGELLSLKECAKRLGVSRTTLYTKGVALGSFQAAVEFYKQHKKEPRRSPIFWDRDLVEVDGHRKTINQWAAQFDLKPEAFDTRMRRYRISLEDAIRMGHRRPPGTAKRSS